MQYIYNMVLGANNIKIICYLWKVSFRCRKFDDFENFWPKNVMQQKIFVNTYGTFFALIYLNKIMQKFHP